MAKHEKANSNMRKLILQAIESLGGSILKNKCDILKITPTNVLSELGDAEKELVKTNNDHQRLQNNFETITKQAKASYSESHTIIYYSKYIP